MSASPPQVEGQNGAVTAAPTSSRRRVGSMELLLAALTGLAITSSILSELVAARPNVAVAATVFCGVFVQALPFLVLGVLLGGVVAAFVSAERLARWLPRRTGLAVVAAGLGGAALPGCECGSVPVARRLYESGTIAAGSGGVAAGSGSVVEGSGLGSGSVVEGSGTAKRRLGSGVVGAAALTFMLAAPAINPVVLVATAVAFPGQPRLVVARCLASLATAVMMGLVWSRWGRSEWVTRALPAARDDAPRWVVFLEAARHDFLQAASYLVVGAAAAAAMRVLVPAWVFQHLAGQLVAGIVVMALLAVVLALCSEADAFVAASLTMMPLLPRLVFLVVGPAIDVKLFAMQAGMFGRRFAVRFAPMTLLVAILAATGIGLVVLGGAH